MTNNEDRKEKTINLSKLIPNKYLMWVVQAEATLGAYECLEIVHGTEPSPTPPANANGTLPAINAPLRIRINDCNHRHARPRVNTLKEPSTLPSHVPNPS